ncbi:BPSL0067 family protein [Azonexus sp.]|uniref:BPSL0067 family protein n=1 Tax=Azonexus sp. TaxID=1872668 RepID=UPI0035AE9102
MAALVAEPQGRAPLRPGVALKWEMRTVAYKLKLAEKDVFGKAKFVNAKGNTECVEFVRQATNAPQTVSWKKGVQVIEAKPGSIPRGTAIATFDKNGRYPTDSHGKHAAIYLSHDASGIRVLDQWNKQGEVLERVIRVNQPEYPRSNAAIHFYVIE